MSVKDVFLDLVSYSTGSDETTGTTPSTPGQKVLGAHIVEHMKSIGIEDAHMDELGYVYGTIPATDARKNTVGFIAHMDTYGGVCGENIKPQVIENYQGDTIALGTSGLSLSPAEYPALKEQVGKTLITTDGTTLLGGDDKAGVAEILCAAAEILKEGKPHGTVKIGFTPDEEIGEGADHFDVAGFGCDYAYTVDGGTLGELEYENFNAASATVEVEGFSIHTGGAKNKMVNALDVACELQGLLPAAERPQYTEGYEGFYHCVGLNGTVEKASVSYIIRDHDAEKFEQKKVFMWACVDLLKKKYGDGVLTLTLKDQYFNMRKMVEPHPQVIDKALKAMEMAGVNPIVRPIRGGTDGARLSFMGLPCPNLFTGGMNFHGKFEYCSLTTMHKTEQVILNLAQLWAE